MKKLVLTFFLLLSLMSYSQEKELREIDLLIHLSSNYLFKDAIKSLTYAKEASKMAEKSGNKVLMFGCYMKLADCLFRLNMHDKSLQYISKADSILPSKNNILEANLTEVKIINFVALEMDDMELRTAHRTLEILSIEHSNEAREVKAKAFTYLCDYYLIQKNYEKANECVNRTIELNESITRLKIIDTYIQKADVLMGMKEMDSAFLYLQKALSKIDEKKDNSRSCAVLCALGAFFDRSGNYVEALENYNKALDEINMFQLIDIECSMLAKKNISTIYSKLDDKENSEKYNTAYKEDRKKYNEGNDKGLIEAVNLILDETNPKKKDQKEKTVNIIIVLSLIFILSSIYCYLRYKAQLLALNQKYNLIMINKNLESENEILHKKAEENQFSDLILLAKNNSPEFLILFEELYPNFVINLKTINPKVKNPEIYFCALAFINFSTKEIAQYTFVSIAAVQLRKHRIRKKYDIPSDVDFNTKMRELNSN